MYYILKNKKPVKVSCLEARMWSDKGLDNRRVALTKIGKTSVSTVFLCIDHNFGGNEPLLFETMVFGGKLDQECTRCSTWKEATKMHKDMIKRVKESRK